VYIPSSVPRLEDVLEHSTHEDDIHPIPVDGSLGLRDDGEPARTRDAVALDVMTKGSARLLTREFVEHHCARFVEVGRYFEDRVGKWQLTKGRNKHVHTGSPMGVMSVAVMSVRFKVRFISLDDAMPAG
jgi:hypothetical protein